MPYAMVFWMVSLGLGRNYSGQSIFGVLFGLLRMSCPPSSQQNDQLSPRIYINAIGRTYLEIAKKGFSSLISGLHNPADGDGPDCRAEPADVFGSPPHEPSTLRGVRQLNTQVFLIELIVLLSNNELIRRIPGICADGSA